LATRLGTVGAKLVDDGEFGIMVAAQGGDATTVPLKDVAGKVKYVPADHPWVKAARQVGTGLGD
ncbi:6-phosphofructokinase, partial [Enterococcus faecalis]|nr:6-phosphofructokinase [Enterococcus faecalis]